MTFETLKSKLGTRVHRASQGLESLLSGLHWRGSLSLLESQIIGDLETEGVHVTTLDRLLPESADALLSKTTEFLATHAESEYPALWKSSLASHDLTAEALLTSLPELYLAGLHDHILGIAQKYLRLPVAFHGSVLRHSLVNSECCGPRHWHVDAEDFRILRTIIYLNDVDSGGGPFEYIPRSLADRVRREVSAAGGMVPSDRMRAILPESHWKQCTGPRGTVIFCDAAQVYHHESVQIDRDRFVLMSGYSSRRPKDIRLARSHFPAERLADPLREIVPAKNRAQVFAWRRRRAEK